MPKILNNKSKLITKKNENLSSLTIDQTKVQLDLLEQAFEAYNTEFDKVT